MQLRPGLGAALAVAIVAALTATASADGELQLRGSYFKEKATRVQQPMLDARFDVGEHGSLDAHVLIDAITSASTASSAEDAAFEETRLEGGAGYVHTLGIYKVGGSARYSTEPDYKSMFGVVRGEAELFQRNLRIGVAAGAGRDDVYEIATLRGELKTYLGSVSVAQILSRNAIGSLTYDVSFLDGFQANPYRRVPIGTLLPENHPSQRLRHAVAASGRWFREPSATTVIGSYRLYYDDWGVLAHTPEVRVLQDVGDDVQVGLRYRFHWQNAADFYQETYAEVPPSGLLSDDEKLSKFTSHTIGMKVSVMGAAFGLEGQLAAVQGDVTIEYDIQDTDFGNAGVAHAGLTIPLEY